MAGPDGEPASEFDDADAVPELESMTGLDVVDFVVLPHYAGEEDTPSHRRIAERYADRYGLISLGDEQAIRVEADGSRALVASP